MHTVEPVILEAVRMQDSELYILPKIVTIVNQNLSVIIYDDYFTSLGLAIILEYGVDKFTKAGIKTKQYLSPSKINVE